jgi:Ser/Thr protein kinase RdoA (MazF antagonist)
LVRGGRPDAGDACHVLVERLLARPPRLDEPLVSLHGDLHFKNFLADGKRLALIDLDTMRPGLPWCDLGSLAASLIAEGLSRGRPCAAIQQTVAVLCDAYRARVEWTIGDEELAWFIDAALLYERAARCVTRLKPGAWALLEAILDWVGAGRTRVRPGDVQMHTLEMHTVATVREVTRS